ncbi:MAG TPA: hypothetical protein VIG99_04940, partial [Myxococcaceae bacterium]
MRAPGEADLDLRLLDLGEIRRIAQVAGIDIHAELLRQVLIDPPTRCVAAQALDGAKPARPAHALFGGGHRLVAVRLDDGEVAGRRSDIDDQDDVVLVRVQLERALHEPEVLEH